MYIGSTPNILVSSMQSVIVRVCADPGSIYHSMFYKNLAGTESTFIISLYLSSSTNNNNPTLGPGIDFTTLY